MSEVLAICESCGWAGLRRRTTTAPSILGVTGLVSLESCPACKSWTEEARNVHEQEEPIRQHIGRRVGGTVRVCYSDRERQMEIMITNPGYRREVPVMRPSEKLMESSFAMEYDTRIQKREERAVAMAISQKSLVLNDYVSGLLDEIVARIHAEIENDEWIPRRS